MKQFLILSIILFFMTGQLFSQPGMNPQKRKEIKEMQLQFIKNKLQLTDKESREFIPAYQAYTEKKEIFYSEKHKLMRNFKQNSLNMSNNQLLQLADKFVNIDLQLAQLDKQYNEKFKKVLPPIKIILLYQAENEFKRELLKKMHHKPGGKMTPK